MVVADVEPIFLSVPREEIAYVKFVFESYEGVAVTRTLDRHAALLAVLVAPDFLPTRARRRRRARVRDPAATRSPRPAGCDDLLADEPDAVRKERPRHDRSPHSAPCRCLPPVRSRRSPRRRTPSSTGSTTCRATALVNLYEKGKTAAVERVDRHRLVDRRRSRGVPRVLPARGVQRHAEPAAQARR